MSNLLQASSEGQQTAQYTALQQYLSESNPDSIEAFCKPVEQSDDAEKELHNAWTCVIATAAATSYEDSDKVQSLVDLVTKVQSRADVQRDGQTLVVQDLKVWSDLPLLGWQVREAWNAAPSDDKNDQHSTQWTNVNAFVAALTASTHSHSNDTPDLSLQGLWTIRAALESSGTPTNASLAAAAVWFVFAAPTLWDFTRQEKSFQGKIAAPGDAATGQGWIGYAQSRWEFWTRAFEHAHRSITDNFTAVLVQQAQDAIAKVAEE